MPKTHQELVAQFKGMPFGTVLVHKRDGTKWCFVRYIPCDAFRDEGVILLEQTDNTVSPFFFLDDHDFPFVTEEEYAEIQQQKEKKELEKQEFEKLYPLGTPVVAVSLSRGTVYCFIVSGHSIKTLGLQGCSGFFPKEDYKFFVVGKEFQVCAEGKN